MFGLSIPIPTLFNIESPDIFKLDNIVALLFNVLNPYTFKVDKIVALFNDANPETFNIELKVVMLLNNV